LASSADATDMSKADLAQLKTRLKAQARYRWRRMEAALVRTIARLTRGMRPGVRRSQKS
jgi:hypothetical protein